MTVRSGSGLERPSLESTGERYSPTPSYRFQTRSRELQLTAAGSGDGLYTIYCRQTVTSMWMAVEKRARLKFLEGGTRLRKAAYLAPGEARITACVTRLAAGIDGKRALPVGTRRVHRRSAQRHGWFREDDRQTLADPEHRVDFRGTFGWFTPTWAILLVGCPRCAASRVRADGTPATIYFDLSYPAAVPVRLDSSEFWYPSPEFAKLGDGVFFFWRELRRVFVKRHSGHHVSSSNDGGRAV